MRTRLARRGGPGGRCHTWLRLSKSHSELRKLIPLYFPANGVTTTTECDYNDVRLNATDSYSGPRPNPDVTQDQKENSTVTDGPSTESNDNCSTSESDNRVFDMKRPRDFTWNVDFPATNKLHGKMNIGLIYESLTMSPIHWKCVPQIHGLPDKHCSALCGVIIRNKRKKHKRVHDLPTNPASLSTKLEPPENSVTVTESNLTKPPKESGTQDVIASCNQESRKIQIEPAEIESVQSPTKAAILEISSAKPEAPDPEDIGAESLTKEDTEEHSTDTNDTIHGRFRSASCRLCQTKLRRNDRVVLRFCCPCFNMLQDFARDYKSTEDLVCLRDTPCLDQWPARPFDPDAPHTTRSAFRHLEEQYGYVTPEWCIPCKVVHSIRLGLKFTIFRSVPAHATRALSLVNLNVLDNPVLQHRGRMRHARACLSLLAQDYTRLCSDSRYTTSSTYLDEPDNKSQDTNLSLCQLLDALWVRPLHLVARGQLRENIPPDEIAEIDTAEKCADVIVPPPDNDTSKTPVGELDSSSVSLSSDSSNVRETEGTASRVTDVVDTDPSAVTAAGETIPLGLTPPYPPSDELENCGSRNLVSSSPNKTIPEDSSSGKISQFRCVLCRFRCGRFKQQTTPVVLDAIQLMLQQNMYAVTVGPVPIRHRAPRVPGHTLISIGELSEPNARVPVNTACSESGNPVSGINPFHSELIQGKVPEDTVSRESSGLDANTHTVCTDHPILPVPDAQAVNAAGVNCSSAVDSCPDDVVLLNESVTSGAHAETTVLDAPVSNVEPCSPTGVTVSSTKGKQNEEEESEQIQTTVPLVETEVNTSSCLTDEKLSIDDPQPGTEAEISITKPLHDNQNSQVIQHISQDMKADEQSETVPNSYSAPKPNSQRDAHFPGHVDRKNLNANEFEICAACLYHIRRTLRSIVNQPPTREESLDRVVNLMQNPNRFCANQNVISQPDSALCSRPPNDCGRCDTCFLHVCLSKLCGSLQSAKREACSQHLHEECNTGDRFASRAKSSRELILPVGGPLLLPLPRDRDSSRSKSSDDSLYARALSPTTTLVTYPTTVLDYDIENNRPACYCCQSSTASFVHCYRVDNDPSHHMLICSGCLWAWMAQVDAAHHDPGVQRIARRLASAAAATDSCVPLLSSASRRTLVDTARLARFFSYHPCSASCTESLSGQGKVPPKPLWFVCPGCVARRLHRLCAARFPLNCPRWYRRCLQLMCRSKSLEDLDPRLLCFTSSTETNINQTRLALVDVEYTDAVIERWLLPPEPPMVAECTALTRSGETESSAESDSEADENATPSDASTGVSSSLSPLRLDEHETEYGAKNWWEQYSESAEEPTKLEEESELAIQGCVHAEKDMLSESEVVGVHVPDETSAHEPEGTGTHEPDETSAHEPEETGAHEPEGTSAHESAETNAHGPDETNFHVPKGTSAHVPEETSVDFVASKRQRKVNPKFAEAVAILRPRTRVTTHASDRIVTEGPVQSENEVASEAETKESALPVKIDEEVATDQEAQGSESNEPTVDEGSSVAPKQTTIDTTSPSASPLPEAGAQQLVRNPRGKRKASPTIEPPIRSKRSLKINARFFDGFTGHFPSFVGEGRQIRDSSPVEDADDSETNEDGEPQSPRRLHDRRGPKQTRLSGSSRGRLESRGGRQSSSHVEDSKTSPSQKSNGWGPRVKQVSRHALRSDPDRYGSTISAMVHAARLAAVGAKIPGGTSPNHAALAATARTVVTTNVSGASGTGGDGAISELPCEDNSDGHGSYDESEVDAGGSSRWSSNRTPASDSARRLPLRCGQCAACIGLIQACGRCTNCRLLQQQSSSNNTASENFKIGPCRQLICFRRRAENVTNKSGPRVKLPTNFASPNSSASPLSGSALATGASVNGNKSGSVSHARQHCPSHRQGSPPPGSTDTPGVSPTAGAVSLLDTVPGLSQQLDADSWITQADRDDGQSSLRGRGVFQSAARYDSLNAHSHRPLTPVSGGDLGMRFNSSNQREDSDSDKDRIRPCEGEAITSELAHQGGYAIVTTMAAAPPKEICYACGSGGGQLLFCVSCAEPYHFYCVERQFRPRRKDHFICRNCTQCGQCRKPAADLRCLRCSAGYHPSCLPDYPPAQSGQRGNWICPNCAVCVHCGTKPSKPMEPGDPFRAPSLSTNSVTSTTTTTTTTISPSERASVSARRLIMVPWSSDVNKCAACSLAVTRGDVCPECDRAYLPTAKQMIQCDSCQLWMHRTCTKLTVDEYEWVARLPPGRLSKFLVNCSVCQNEKRHRENVLPGSFATDVDEHCRSLRPSDPLSVDVLDEDLETNGASRLRIIARDTLMERMADLVTNCRQLAGPSGSPLPSPSNLPSTNATTTGYAGTTGDRSNFSPTSSSSQDNVTRFNQDPMVCHRQSSQDSDYVTEKRIPQLDGTGNVDSDEDERSSQKRTPSSLSKVYKPRGRSSGTIDPPISRASDVLLDEHDSSCSDVMSNSLFPSGRLVQLGSNLGTHSSPGSGSWNAPHANRVVYDPTSSRSITRMRHSNPYHHRTDSSVPDRMGLRFSRAIEDDRSSMVGLCAAPPTNAKWLVEDEFEQIWTSPRAMIYRLLTRILHKLSAHPTSSPYATTLRRLLRWLSQITESFFPWLNLSEMASDVRDVLRQTNGEFNPVLRHFERLALIELHELVCPVVARLSECQLHVRLPVSGLRATNCVLSVQTLHSTIMQHLRSNHSLTLSHSSTLASNILPEWRALAEARLFITRIPPSQCHRPHELEVMDRMRNEAREERWVEHWSSIEEEMVLQYFQRHLARLSIRLRREALGQAGRNSNTHRSATAIPPRSEDQARIDLPSNSGVESEMNHLEATGKQIDRAVTSEAVAAVASALDEAFQDVDSVLAAEQEEMSDKHLLIPPQANNFEPQTAGQQSEITTDLVKPLCSTSQLSSPAPVQMEPFYFARANVWTAAMGHRIDSSLNTANKKFGSSDGMEISNNRDPTADFDLELDSGDEDVRCCLLCGHHGDSNIEGRLLFTGADTWVHVNCALWSNEVYEEETGQLIGLSDALRRARTSVCGDCGRFGATMICSNAHDPGCPLHSPGTTPCSGDTQCVSSGINLDPDKAHAIHFACALRRRPPAPRSVFTADRSWFCSPECHRATGRQRLSDGIREMRRTHRPHGRQAASFSRGRSTRFELPADADDLDMDGDSGVNVADPFDETSTDPFLDRQELLELENNVADDLEPISLGELLVCRRVFVPSDCFTASLYPASVTARGESYRPWITPDANPRLQVAAQLATKNLAVSPNSLAFLQCTGLAANSLVVTIGSLRIDRLGEVREASDALASVKSNSVTSTGVPIRRWNYLCPINYRARRIFWSCTKLDARISYTLHVRQTHTVHFPVTNLPFNSSQTKSFPGRQALFDSIPVNRASHTAQTTGNRLLENELRTCMRPAAVQSSTQSPLIHESIVPSYPGLPGLSKLNSQEKPHMGSSNPGDRGNKAAPMLNPYTMWQRPSVHSDGMPSPRSTTLSNSSELLPVPDSALSIRSTIGNNNGTAVTTTTIAGTAAPMDTNPVLTAQLSCRVSAPTETSAMSTSEANSGASSMKILKTVSLAKTARFPLSSAVQSGQTRITYSGSTNPLVVAKPVQAPINVVTTIPMLLRPTNTVTPSTSQSTRNPVCWPVPIHTIQSCPTVLTTAVTTPITTVPTPAVMAKPVGNPATPTIRLTGGTGGVIRIQHMPWHRPTTLTTPTKDLQLAIQLNGLFQNLPTTRPAVPRASLPIGNPCRQIPLNGANAGQRTRTEPTPPVTHLLPQLDGTLDLDEDYDPSKPENPPPRKRTRPIKRYHLRRTPSVTSNDSSNSTQSSRTSIRHRGHMSRHKQRHSTSSSPSSTNLDHRRDKPSQPFLRQNKPALVPALSPRAPPIRRRWIEERSRQQELAHLVSKAKQANQARLYQSEVEKHTRAYRLRFAIDGVVRAAANPSVAWQTVLSRVAALRERHGLPPLIYSGADGWAQFGLNHRHVIFLVEQMRGAFHCYRYRFQYHRRKVERLRQKFTPPVPLTEGCARALMWTKPRRPAHHARDPLDFLSCAANPPPRPCFTPTQTMFPHNSTSAVAHTPTTTSGPSGILSPEEPATMLSPSERIVCAEAARQAASLVASQLKLPMRVREACIARAVVQATGLPINPNGSSDVDELQSPVRCRDTENGSVNRSDPWVDADDEDDEDDDQDEVEGEDSSELCTVSTQFKSVISGPMTRLLRVAVHPSRIHGRGLFALRGFREDEMIIEYLGERIRNLVCETREIRYRAAGVDCYMFRIDPEWVIDATYAGNAARFINHSCEPNCYAKVISVEDKKHIVILAQRRIYPGEELTYDYRFPKESDKLLCNCGSYMCRRYLN